MPPAKSREACRHPYSARWAEVYVNGGVRAAKVACLRCHQHIPLGPSSDTWRTDHEQIAAEVAIRIIDEYGYGDGIYSDMVRDAARAAGLLDMGSQHALFEGWCGYRSHDHSLDEELFQAGVLARTIYDHERGES